MFISLAVLVKSPYDFMMRSLPLIRKRASLQKNSFIIYTVVYSTLYTVYLPRQGLCFMPALLVSLCFQVSMMVRKFQVV